MKMTYWSIFILVVIIYVTVYTMAPENKEKNDVNLYFFFLDLSIKLYIVSSHRGDSNGMLQCRMTSRQVKIGHATSKWRRIDIHVTSAFRTGVRTMSFDAMC